MIRDGFLSHIRRLNEEDSRLSDKEKTVNLIKILDNNFRF